MIPKSHTGSSGPAPSFFRVRSALVFCAPMMVNGIAMPYFPVWLESLKMNETEIGFILAVPMILRIISAPLVSVLADRIGERADILIWSGILSLTSAIVLLYTHSFWLIALVFGLQGAVYAPFVPVTEALLMTGVRRWGFDYGHMRLWGSLAFILATVVGGYAVGRYGGDLVLPAMMFAFCLTVIAGVIAPRVGKPVVKPDPVPGTPHKRSALKDKDFLALLMGVSLSGSSHAMLFAFSAIYWQQLGFSGTAIGLLWSAGVLAEVVVFIFSRWLVQRVSLWALIFAGLGIAILRWVLFPELTSFPALFALQCLHAFTFATAHIGVQNMIVRRVAAEQEASAQGLYFFFNGLFMALSTLLSGYAYERFGLHGFYAMSAVSGLGLSFALWSYFHQPQRDGSGGKTMLAE
jgi:MFS transporter, PPP family, 3-phenylpropionic acid transporter